MGLTDEQYRKVMRKGWNLTVTEYDRSWVGVLGRFSAGCVERAGIGRGERVLDIATGPGTAAFLAAERTGPTGVVLGTDISDAFVDAARERARGLDHVRFERRPMEDLGVPDGSVDVVLCAFGLMYAAPLDAALAEIARVLAPGGRIAACVWGERAKCGFREVFPILGERLQMDVCPLFFSLGVPGAFEAALGRAGLADAREERTELTLHWNDGEDAATAMIEGGPVAYPYAHFPPDIQASVRRAYIASLEPYRRGTALEVPAEFVYATARKPG